jgi:hypothetical protein
MENTKSIIGLGTIFHKGVQNKTTIFPVEYELNGIVSNVHLFIPTWKVENLFGTELQLVINEYLNKK